MQSSANALCKLYLSVIDDVIENVRELFLDEEVEDGVLNELHQLWVTKVMQSKAVDGFRKDAINPSNFALQLPASYTQTLQKQSAASIILPPGQNVQNYTAKTSGAAPVTTFSLPPGVTYPVHIPAGVTLQTASGHLYKVNVPVVVTQATRSNRTLPQAAVQKASAPSPTPHPAPNQPHTAIQQVPIQTPDQEALPNAPSNVSEPEPEDSATQIDQQAPEAPAPVSQSVPAASTTQPVAESPGEFTLDDVDFSPYLPETGLNLCPEVDVKQEQEPLPSCQMAMAGDTPDTPEVKEETADEFPVCDVSAFASLGIQLDEAIRMERLKDFNFSGLEDLVQLDGAGDGSSDEDDEDGMDIRGPVGDNDFLTLISAEALDALKEAGSSDEDGNASSSSGDEEQPVIIEEDPLNSGDDVSDQDIPDLFDTENVVVCLYEKIHRSKNNWKFNLRDGVMTYGGKDYVFSRAIGEAEW
ncbi:hypothetical protein ACEWY4_020781 [Coilia grayii]|uniref:General transcription factor IIA, 1-like n=1 Tax=Coilia grayii TaxID=363190 RepID=A0ABD1J755_9TELE